ncbi:HU family DNA-binding protein [Octadecabacter sp. 1_MG-2023]|uniref:HU family DNA-binding protein n=1 Tax=unclassified Octadecabacter TaxID=196158 RepID=UPI001C081080|nr:MULTISPECIES: HU family DNA-binding protein [unclassified Octadecabacter]MBU2993518.1 HU family DNA-binding protein [Octadecabacter sp. B2R22]MDO6735639.1 HU family DNA-binding protein [Octadecabacter sp. 1_MG-2023]
MATRSTKTTTPKAKTTTKTAAATTKTTTTAAAKAAPAPATKATIVESVTPVVTATPIKKPELIDRVMAETGMKKKDVKPVVEAMLTVLGRTLADGEELTVPPLGKVMIKRVKDVANAKIMTLKVRQPKGDNGPSKAPVAAE